jgi:ABC-type branched-subunit amino acid transport system substrate-binding protein
MGGRASYLTKEKGFDRNAILYQDDSFGRVGLAGVKKAMAKRGLKLVAEGTYKRNTVAVKSGFLKIRKAKPEAVVMVGAYKPCAAFIKLAKKTRLKATFVNISFVGSKALAKELGKDGEGEIVSQVVPFPWNSSILLVKAYQTALKAHDATAEPGFVTLEGYMVGRLVIKALGNMNGEINRGAVAGAGKAVEPAF